MSCSLVETLDIEIWLWESWTVIESRGENRVIRSDSRSPWCGGTGEERRTHYGQEDIFQNHLSFKESFGNLGNASHMGPCEVSLWPCGSCESLGPGLQETSSPPPPPPNGAWMVHQQTRQALGASDHLFPSSGDWPTWSETAWSEYQSVGTGQTHVSVTDNPKISAT